MTVTIQRPDETETAAKPAEDVGLELDAIYDEALSEMLDGESSTQSGDARGQVDRTDHASVSHGFTEDERQLLRRMHVAPELISAWPDEARKDFLANAAKRESDQAAAFARLKSAGEPASMAKPPVDPSGQETAPKDGDGADLGEEIDSIVAELTDVFGQEIAPVGAMMRRMLNRMHDVEQTLASRSQLLAEVILDQSVGGLNLPDDAVAQVHAKASEILSDEARAKTLPRNPMARFRAALNAAAKELGHSTDQSNTGNRARSVINGTVRPAAGGRSGPPVGQSIDDIYDEAYASTIGKG